MPDARKPATIYDVAEHAGVSISTVSNVLNKPERVAVGTRRGCCRSPTSSATCPRPPRSTSPASRPAGSASSPPSPPTRATCAAWSGSCGRPRRRRWTSRSSTRSPPPPRARRCWPACRSAGGRRPHRHGCADRGVHRGAAGDPRPAGGAGRRRQRPVQRGQHRRPRRRTAARAAPARARSPAHRLPVGAAGLGLRVAGPAAAGRLPRRAGRAPRRRPHRDPGRGHDGRRPRGGAHPARLPDRPTAVMAHFDDLALGVVHAAAELGLDVPGDLSVLGFDDGPAAEAAGCRRSGSRSRSPARSPSACCWTRSPAPGSAARRCWTAPSSSAGRLRRRRDRTVVKSFTRSS